MLVHKVKTHVTNTSRTESRSVLFIEYEVHEGLLITPTKISSFCPPPLQDDDPGPGDIYTHMHSCH